MARAVGLMNPDLAAKSSGPFREGYVRIDANGYVVHAGKPGEGESPVPATKWLWQVTRLNENGEDPLTDENDQEVKELLYFSFGGKCLPFVHPGNADSPEDEEPEDLGTEITPEGSLGGNTVFMIDEKWKPNERSGLMVLTRSLTKLGVKSEYLNRCWAPEWNGCIFELKGQAGEKGADGRQFNYKVASRVLNGPGGRKSAKGGIAAVGANGKMASDAETAIVPILNALSVELDGEQISRKVLVNRVRTAAEAAKVDNRLLVPIVTLCKDNAWMAANAAKFDLTFDPAANTVTFGGQKPTY